MDTLKRLRREYGQTRAHEVNVLMEGLGRTFTVFDANRSELEHGLREFRDDTIFALERMRDGGDLDRFLTWLDKALHNYIAASMTLKDHATRASRKLLPASSLWGNPLVRPRLGSLTPYLPRYAVASGVGWVDVGG